MTPAQEQARADAFAETLERGRDACTPYRRHDFGVMFVATVTLSIIGAATFILAMVTA